MSLDAHYLSSADPILMLTAYADETGINKDDFYQPALIRTLRPILCVLSRLCAKAGP